MSIENLLLLNFRDKMFTIFICIVREVPILGDRERKLDVKSFGKWMKFEFLGGGW